MAVVERSPGGSSLIDVLDRILDKGIVIDAWVRVSLVGIDLITVEARVVVASIDTYLRYADALGISPRQSRTGTALAPRRDKKKVRLTPNDEPITYDAGAVSRRAEAEASARPRRATAGAGHRS